MNTETLEQYSLKWSGHIQHVRTAFNKLLLTNELCDVTFYIEGKKIQAHKVLLSACSKYFDQLFKDFTDERPIIVLKGVQYHMLKHILSFIYKGEVNVEKEELNQFLEAAAFLKIDGLIEHYNKRKRKTSDSDNVSIGSEPEPEHTLASKRGTFTQTHKSLVRKQSIAAPKALHDGKNPEFSKPLETGKYSIKSPDRVGEWLSDYEFVSQSSNIDSQSPYHENIDDPGIDTSTDYPPQGKNMDNPNTGPNKRDLLLPIKTEMVGHLPVTGDEISFDQDEFANSLDAEIETGGDDTDGTLEKEMMKSSVYRGPR